jgi:hypothetical protein
VTNAHFAEQAPSSATRERAIFNYPIASKIAMPKYFSQDLIERLGRTSGWGYNSDRWLYSVRARCYSQSVEIEMDVGEVEMAGLQPFAAAHAWGEAQVQTTTLLLVRMPRGEESERMLKELFPI